MNDLGRDTLIRAGLAGHTQRRFILHGSDGDCAFGVLHLAMHASREEAWHCYEHPSVTCHDALRKRFMLTAAQVTEIIALNDSGIDFIGIARKLGNGDGGVSPQG